MATGVLAGPVAGDRLVRMGLALSVKVRGLLATPPMVTTTLPVAVPTGGKVTICVGPHIVGVAGMPLKVTVLVPGDKPKGPPLICTAVPTVPEVGDKLVMVGLTVKLIALLR